MFNSTLSLTLPPDGGGWSTPRPGCFTYCVGDWVGPEVRSGRVQKLSPPPGFDPGPVQPVASRYTDCAIPAHGPYSV
jgi:hypothetical protein